MNDYDRIAKVITWLVDNYREQPGLDNLAEISGMSRFHFHRTFRRLAGTTPKAFTQQITALEAGRLLRSGVNVFDTSLEVGLSGPGRLHDLCVKVEAASPGEIRSGGKSWTITYGIASTPFGAALISEGPRGICWFSFFDVTEGLAVELAGLQDCWPNASLVRDDGKAVATAGGIFAPGGEKSPVKVVVKGSEFQLRVWRALVEIPYGAVVSYKEVAERTGNPGASRAVGNAAAQNCVSYLIPCHRVIAATGKCGNYRWNPERKKALLAWEAAVSGMVENATSPVQG